MICTGTQGITALEFYLSLHDRDEDRQCKGPIAYLRVSAGASRVMMSALAQLEQEACLEEAYISRVSDETALFGSCVAHWLDITALVGELGHQLQRNDFMLVSQKIYQKVCKVAGWDWRELDNYLESMGMLDD